VQVRTAFRIARAAGGADELALRHDVAIAQRRDRREVRV